MTKAWICEMSNSSYSTWKWLCKEHVLSARAAIGRIGQPLWLSVKQRLDDEGRPMVAPCCDVCSRQDSARSEEHDPVAGGGMLCSSGTDVVVAHGASVEALQVASDR